MMSTDEMNKYLDTLLNGTVDPEALTSPLFSFLENIEQEVSIVDWHSDNAAQKKNKDPKKPQEEECNAYFHQLNEALSADPLTPAEQIELFEELCNDMPAEDVVTNLSLIELDQITKSLCPPSPEEQPPSPLKMQRPRRRKAPCPYQVAKKEPRPMGKKPLHSLGGKCIGEAPRTRAQDSSQDSSEDSSDDSSQDPLQDPLQDPPEDPPEDSSDGSSGNPYYYVNDNNLEWSAEAMEEHFAKVTKSYYANKDYMPELQNHTDEAKEVDIGTACNGEFKTTLRLAANPGKGDKVYWIQIRPKIPDDEDWVTNMNKKMRTFTKGTNVHRLQVPSHIRAFFYAYDRV